MQFRAPLIFMSKRGRTTVRAIEGSSSVSFDPPRALLHSQPATKTDVPMKKPTGGETDKLRELTEEPELQALIERYDAAPPGGHESYETFLETFTAKAGALYPDWRETWQAAESNGSIVRALAMNCVLQIRARSDLDELERFEAKIAEANFVMSFDEVAKSPNASAAFRMMSAFYELMRIAKLDPEEMEELRRQAVRTSALNASKTPKKERPRVAHARELALAIANENPGFSFAQIVEEIPNRWRLKSVACFTPRWLAELVPRWLPPRRKSARRTYPLQRYRRF